MVTVKISNPHEMSQYFFFSNNLGVQDGTKYIYQQRGIFDFDNGF